MYNPVSPNTCESRFSFYKNVSVNRPHIQPQAAVKAWKQFKRDIYAAFPIWLSHAGRLPVMMMRGSCSCLVALAISLELTNSVEDSMGCGMKDTWNRDTPGHTMKDMHRLDLANTVEDNMGWRLKDSWDRDKHNLNHIQWEMRMSWQTPQGVKNEWNLHTHFITPNDM